MRMQQMLGEDAEASVDDVQPWIGPLRLGEDHYLRFERSDDIHDLEAAIAYHHEALSLLPQGSRDIQRFRCFHKLSIYYKASFEHDPSRTASLLSAAENSIAAEALAIGIDHPYLTWFNFCLQRSEDPNAPDIDPDTPLSPSHKTSSYTATSAESRFRDAVWLAEAAVSRDISCAVQIYRTAFLIAERCLVLRFTPALQHEFLSKREVRMLPSRAASCAVQAGDLEAAVELLEQGRGQIWARMRDYRYPLENLPDISEKLCERFRETCVALELSSAYGSDSEEASEYKRSILDNWNSTLCEIRDLDGFDGFLQPKKFSALCAAAAMGPIIILYADIDHSGAIIIPSSKAAPSLVALSCDLYDMTLDFVHTVTHLDGRTRRVVLSDPESGPPLTSVVKSIWKYICAPVVTRLRELGVSEQSRIWWCPTGPLTSLPIHAAGPYKSGEKNLIDVYVSSYASSLLSLIRAQASEKENALQAKRSVRLLAVGQSNVLVKVKDELRRLERRFSSSACIFDASAATADAVLQEQLTGGFDIVHFSCHGFLDAVRPFESYLSLYRSNLALKALAYSTAASSQLAFLAACDSAAGETASSNRLPADEIISLAAAYQIVGAQSVIGTLWAMFDVDGPELSDAFYGHLLPEDIQSSDRTISLEPARALHFAVKDMRDRGVPLERWGTFVHIGI